MLRLPLFRYCSPATVEEAADLLAEAPATAMLVAGGTDVVPKMKRRQHTPQALIGLRRIAALRTTTVSDEVTIGAGTTLADLLENRDIRQRYQGLWQAAVQIATPQLRNMGTLGGNLCLDTRCTYYDQTHEWRKAIHFCLKKDGDTCWVAPSSPRCLAVSSGDTAPMLVALGASVTLVSANGTRRLPLTSFYKNDGIGYLAKDPREIVTAVHLPALAGWRSTYWKLRRRGAFDFPVLSVAAAGDLAPDGTVRHLRLVVGAAASCPVDASAAASGLLGGPLSDSAVAETAERAARVARPVENTDFSVLWRKRMTRALVTYALAELRGDDVRAWRRRMSRWDHSGG
jgi:4-hydroxybenzoyl-CoA reductase subunit beta